MDARLKRGTPPSRFAVSSAVNGVAPDQSTEEGNMPYGPRPRIHPGTGPRAKVPARNPSQAVLPGGRSPAPCYRFCSRGFGFQVSVRIPSNHTKSRSQPNRKLPYRMLSGRDCVFGGWRVVTSRSIPNSHRSSQILWSGRVCGSGGGQESHPTH